MRPEGAIYFVAGPQKGDCKDMRNISNSPQYQSTFPFYKKRFLWFLKKKETNQIVPEIPFKMISHKKCKLWANIDILRKKAFRQLWNFTVDILLWKKSTLHGFLRQMGHFLTNMSNRVEHWKQLHLVLFSVFNAAFGRHWYCLRARKTWRRRTLMGWMMCNDCSIQ